MRFGRDTDQVGYDVACLTAIGDELAEDNYGEVESEPVKS